jgi:type IV secretion system protein VirD4
MDDNKFIIALRNFVIIGCFHIIQLLVCFWISGAIVAYFTNEFSLIGLNNNALEVAYKWGKWLISIWGQLPFDGYNYLKLKLSLSFIIPLLICSFLYYKYFDKIKAWRPYKTKEKVYGDARWATPEDINRAGLRSKHGMLLGQDKSGYYVADGFQHALLFAPTGSGKGVGFVIPNLLFWEHSVVVHDIKLENHELTSGWRAKQGQEVFVWEPANPDGRTHCYNPIDWVSHKPGQMVDDVQKISNLIMPEKDFWNNEARSLFVGVVLYLIADPSKPKTFGEVVRTMRSDDVVYNLAVVLDTLGKVIHPVAFMNLAAFLQKADKERSGVISTLNSSLELWANPLIDAATASSDFNIQEFKKKKTTVYVGLTPDNITRLQKLMQVFYQQATEFLSRKMPDLKEEPYGVMFLMDEFPTLGKMEQFKTGIAYFRGYRVRLFLIIQDTQQLKGTYEEAGMNSFLSNSTFRITFAANNYETANLISQLCGNKTVQQTSQSKPKFFDLNPATRTVNISEVQRALLLPQEVIQLPRDEQIVLIESFPPIKSNKIKYFDDKFFTKRLLPPTFVPTQEPYDPRKSEEEGLAEDENFIDEEEEEFEDNINDASEDVIETNDENEIPEEEEEEEENEIQADDEAHQEFIEEAESEEELEQDQELPSKEDYAEDETNNHTTEPLKNTIEEDEVNESSEFDSNHNDQLEEDEENSETLLKKSASEENIAESSDIEQGIEDEEEILEEEEEELLTSETDMLDHQELEESSEQDLFDIQEGTKDLDIINKQDDSSLQENIDENEDLEELQDETLEEKYIEDKNPIHEEQNVNQEKEPEQTIADGASEVINEPDLKTSQLEKENKIPTLENSHPAKDNNDINLNESLSTDFEQTLAELDEAYNIEEASVDQTIYSLTNNNSPSTEQGSNHILTKSDTKKPDLQDNSPISDISKDIKAPESDKSSKNNS